jgi:Flp pilus assembly protein TadD
MGDRKTAMQSQAHEALGVVSLDRGQARTAVSEFQAAVALAPHAEGALFLRLGLALALAGQPVDAEKNLLRAEALGGLRSTTRSRGDKQAAPEKDD